MGAAALAAVTAWLTGGLNWLAGKAVPHRTEPLVSVAGGRVPHSLVTGGRRYSVSQAAAAGLMLDPAGDGGCGPMVVNVPPGRLRPPAPPADGAAAAAQEDVQYDNEADPDSTALGLVVQASPGHTAILYDIRIKVIRRLPAPARDAATVVKLETPAGCGGVVLAHVFRASLDDQVPHVVPDKGEHTNFPYSVSENDPQEFEITVASRHCDCTWVPELVWSVDGHMGVTDYEQPPAFGPAVASPYHTEPSTGYARIAWSDKASSGREWVRVPFGNG
ncbi:MAG: hypothetical protein JOY82_11370 [Streptosporangiaceae bacterium]|nr:hypothetical protein [Streptosporangiaceae bacterium]MBV9855097.1 hypothetical protein [Streptosporangiaceae bacterium]